MGNRLGSKFLFLPELAGTLGWLANEIERRKRMSNTNQQGTQRALGRTGARILTPEEIARVRGGENQTFAFTHIINPDTTHD
jgi:hypothetical protein